MPLYKVGWVRYISVFLCLCNVFSGLVWFGGLVVLIFCYFFGWVFWVVLWRTSSSWGFVFLGLGRFLYTSKRVLTLVCDHFSVITR